MPKINPDFQPAPCASTPNIETMTAEEASIAIANNLLSALDILGSVLETLVPGSAPGRPDAAGEGLLNHLEFCRQLADSTALHAGKIADMIGAHNH